MTARPEPPAPLEAEDVLAGPVVDVAGIPIRLGASDAARAEAVASLFRHAVPSQSRPRITLHFEEHGIGVPTEAADTAVVGAEIWRPAPGQIVLRTPEGLTARSSATEIVVGGDSTTLARVFRYACLLALTHALARHGRFLLHAGAVVADGHALLVLGETGTGKSTLTFAAHRLGWPVLADDVVAVRRQDGRVVAQGMPRPVAVPEDVIVEPVPGGRPVPHDLRNRTELPTGTLSAGLHPVAGIVVTGRGDRRHSTIESIAAHETMRTVLGASISLADPDLRAEVLAIAAALARLPAWSLRHGSEPASGLDDVTRQLHSVRRRLRAPTGAPRSGRGDGANF